MFWSALSWSQYDPDLQVTQFYDDVSAHLSSAYLKWVKIKPSTVSRLWLVIFSRPSLIQEWVFMEHGGSFVFICIGADIIMSWFLASGAVFNWRKFKHFYAFLTDTGVLGLILIYFLKNQIMTYRAGQYIHISILWYEAGYHDTADFCSCWLFIKNLIMFSGCGQDTHTEGRPMCNGDTGRFLN